MLSLLLRSQHSYLRRKYVDIAQQNYKRGYFTKPFSPNLQAASSPCDLSGGGSGSGAGGSRHQITFQPYQPPPPKQHDYKNMDLGRPMSPHLTIYAPTITAATSILQRITGTILVFYTVMLSGGTLFLSNGVETYVSMIQSLDLNRLSILVIKLIIGLPFAFHYSNGIRFCMWNAARMMTMKEVFDSAKKCFIMAGTIAFLFALL